MVELVTFLLWLAAIIVVLVLDWYIANSFYEIACDKGFYDSRYFWISLLTGLPGYLLVVALPDRKNERAEAAKAATPLTNRTGSQTPVGKWACPDCGNVLPGDVIRCKCGYKRYQPAGNSQPVQEPAGKWACPNCGEVLPGAVTKCQCGYKKYVHK